MSRETRDDGLVKLGLLAGVSVAFAIVVALVSTGATQQLDQQAIASLRWAQLPGELLGPLWLLPLVKALTALADATAVLLVVTGAMLGFLLRGRRLDALVILAAPLGAWALSPLLKGWFDRPRPDIVPPLTEVTWASFPSGHSMVAAATYLTLAVLIAPPAPLKRGVALALGAALAGAIGATRVFLAAHYPTDVLAGWLAGTAWALFCLLLRQILQNRLGRERVLQGSRSPA